MDKDKILINKIRAFYFMAGVLAHQERDYRCSVCKSRKEVFEELIEEFEDFKMGIGNIEEMPEILRSLINKTIETLESLKLPERPIPQRKEGACHFPDKECLIKECMDIFEDLVEEDEA
ncbi:MAG: hypothetical protein N2Z40_01765 [Caldimicrobium sp.]|nr:hypothetical protein [Caldimicrobium sp.]MCX7612938.1 hypothetical protein [Caldimicrobium sp.]MDW8182095.1 hypothetical protein [Caldimicrobium sp.]